MAGYSEDFKKSIVRKALLPENPGAAKVAEEAGISLQTLYNWLRKLRADVEMGKAVDPKDRSILEKQAAILEPDTYPGQTAAIPHPILLDTSL